MCAELTRGYFLEHNEAKYTERREKVYTCMRIPKELEKVGVLFTHCPVYFLTHEGALCSPSGLFPNVT